MKLAEIQAVYFLLNSLQFENSPSKKVTLYVKHDGLLFSADFLQMTSSRRSVTKRSFQYDFDVFTDTFSIRKGADSNFLWALSATEWFNEFTYTDFSNNQLRNPDILLTDLIETVLKVSSEKNYDSFTQLAYNVSYLNGNKFDFCILPNEEYEIFSIEVSES